MNWITDYVPPKIKSFFQRREMPENLWLKCDGCGQMLFHRDITDALNVCPACGHHMGLEPAARFAALFDHGAWAEIEVPEPLADPLQFRDEKRYTERLRDARRKTDAREAILVGKGQIFGLDVVAAAQDFRFMGGSMGMAVGNALLAAAEAAVGLRAPLVVFAAAGGARMQEGILSLMQMPRTTLAVAQLRDAGLPYIVVLTNPTTGGVTASYAMLGDVQIAEPGALICFAGPRVIEQTIGEKLPEGFQRAEYLLDHGMIDAVIPRKRQREELGTLLRLLLSLPSPVRGALERQPPSPAPAEIDLDLDVEAAAGAGPGIGAGSGAGAGVGAGAGGARTPTETTQDASATSAGAGTGTADAPKPKPAASAKKSAKTAAAAKDAAPGKAVARS